MSALVSCGRTLAFERLVLARRSTGTPAYVGIGCELLADRKAVHLRVERIGLRACLPLRWHVVEYAAFCDVLPYVALQGYRICERDIEALVARARTPAGSRFTEMLAYLQYHEAPDRLVWSWYIPEQVRTPVSVAPVRGDVHVPNVVVEFHTHPAGCVAFSTQDDAAQTGIRVHLICCDVDIARPRVFARLSAHRRHVAFPASLIADLPAGYRDPLLDKWLACVDGRPEEVGDDAA